jgi:hypothetical protein
MSKKLTIEFIKSEFAKEDYKLLTTEYKNNEQRLNYICPRGHKYNITWHNWIEGRRCPCQSNLMKPTIEFIRSKFAKEDYQLLTTEYINAQKKLEYICSKGHRHNITWNHWQQGSRCPCSTKYRNKYTIEFIRSEFKKKGYTLLTTEYKNKDQKLKYICPNRHRHGISWHNWQKGVRCPYCYGSISKSEVEVRNFVKSLGIKVLANNRDQIFNPETEYGLELDIFMPTINKAIEYNGEYWHQNESRDMLKQELCESKGIGLLIIWDRKWKISGEKCKNKIKKFIFNKS